MSVPLRGLRVFPELRAAHLEELDRFAPRRTLFFERKYDMAGQSIPSHCVQVGVVGAIRELWRSDETTLELPEPLWLRFFPLWLLFAITWKLRRLRGARERRIAFFAIENNGLPDLIPHRSSGGKIALRLATRLIRWATTSLAARCAFGTPAAQEAYSGLLGPTRPLTVLTLDLPSARVPVTGERHRHAAIFVGALEERKGIQLLAAAWPQVEAACPSARLQIIGDGPLRPELERWAAGEPRSLRLDGMLPREAALRAISTSSVLVAPSVRRGRWREQVGRPIQEALATGGTVVTTEDTGLATWLRQHGHYVIPRDPTAKQLAGALTTALLRPLSPDAVLASLPAVDGRLAADAWMHE